MRHHPYHHAPRWLKLTVNWLLRPLGVRRPMIGFTIFLSKEQRAAIRKGEA